jgi:hypothetical protein
MMPYPTREEFLVMLYERNHAEIVEEHLVSGLPFAFQENATAYDLLLNTLSEELRLRRESITMVGSGRIGFSLSPDKFGTPFSSESDLDMLIVSEELFDKAWFDMLKLGRKYSGLEVRVRNWVDAHRMNNIYWGFIQPDRLPGVVQIAAAWFRAFRGLSRHRDLARREIGGRLYRTWDHVQVHQLHTLRMIQRARASEQKES